MPLKIAFFVCEFPPRLVGGLGTYAMEICHELVREGHEICVFTMNTFEDDLLTKEFWKGIEVHRPQMVNCSEMFSIFAGKKMKKLGPRIQFFADMMVYNVLSASKLVNELIRKEGRNFDLISVHDWHSVLGGIATKRELNLPLVFHIHSTEKGRTLGKGSALVEKIELKGANTSDGIVTVSWAMKEELALMGSPVEKINVCWNGVDAHRKYNPAAYENSDAPRLLREKYNITENEYMLFFIGRLIPVKGADMLVQAMPYVIEKIPNTKLVIVGVGYLQVKLQKMINQLGLKENVILRYEFIPEEERILHYAACDAAVFPSLYEPFGIVATEAMSMQKPVVVGARGTSGLREQVVPEGGGQCGYHINPFDPKDIAWGVIETLKNGRDYMRKLGDNGRKRVLDLFTWERVAQRLLPVYEKLIQ